MKNCPIEASAAMLYMLWPIIEDYLVKYRSAAVQLSPLGTRSSMLARGPAWRRWALVLAAGMLCLGTTLPAEANWFHGQTPAHAKMEGEGKPARHHPPTSARAALLAKRDEAHIFKAALVEGRAGAIIESHKFGRPAGMRARPVARLAVWRCCPASWFHTKAAEVDAEVYLLRPLRTGSTTLQGVLWAWAAGRHVPVLSHARDMNDSRVAAVTPGAPADFAARNAGRAARLYDARLPLWEYERVASARAVSLNKIAAAAAAGGGALVGGGLRRRSVDGQGALLPPAGLSLEAPVFVTLLREPLGRAIGGEAPAGLLAFTSHLGPHTRRRPPSARR